MTTQHLPATVSPAQGSRILREWNERRRLERAVQENARRGLRASVAPPFAGAAINRLTASLASWSGALNADLDAALVPLRARARRLCANNEWGKRFLSLCAVNIVGPMGPALQVRAKRADGTLDIAANEAIETHWAAWARAADITGRMALKRLLQVTVKALARDGEILVRLVMDRTLPYGFAVQLLEIDRLDERLNQRLQNGNTIRQGVEIDSRMRPLAYYVMTDHPGEVYTSIAGRQYERIPAREIYHVFLPERAEQVRGYTWLHAVLLRADMTGGYEESAIVAARVGAAKMGVFERDEEGPSPASLATIADGVDAQTGALQMDAEPGEFIELPAGYKLSSWDPEYPHENFEPFLKQCLRGLAVGLDVATHNLSGDMTGVNYSSARVAELSEREIWMLLQEWLFDALLMPLYRTWLESALIRGDITFETSGLALPVERLQKFVLAARFQGRRWGWVDPLNEAQAAAVRVANRIDSRTAIAASQGREFGDVVEELGAEAVALADNGLPETGTTATKAAAPT